MRKVTIPSGSLLAVSTPIGVGGREPRAASESDLAPILAATTTYSSIVLARRKKCTLYEGRTLHVVKSAANSPSLHTSCDDASIRPSLMVESGSRVSSRDTSSL